MDSNTVERRESDRSDDGDFAEHFNRDQRDIWQSTGYAPSHANHAVRNAQNSTNADSDDGHTSVPDHSDPDQAAFQQRWVEDTAHALRLDLMKASMGAAVAAICATAYGLGAPAPVMIGYALGLIVAIYPMFYLWRAGILFPRKEWRPCQSKAIPTGLPSAGHHWGRFFLLRLARTCSTWFSHGLKGLPTAGKSILKRKPVAFILLSILGIIAAKACTP